MAKIIDRRSCNKSNMHGSGMLAFPKIDKERAINETGIDATPARVKFQGGDLKEKVLNSTVGEVRKRMKPLNYNL